MMRLYALNHLGGFLGALHFFEVLVLASALASTRSVGRAVVGTRLSVIKGLLVAARHNVNARQEEVCPIPGGIICNAEYCCPEGSFCQPANPLPFACCSSSIGISCNGGTACCDKELEICCTTDPEGCCLLDNTPPAPSGTVPGSPTPTETRIPKDTIALDYEDMLIPRKKEQNAEVRKDAVNSLFKNMCLGMQRRGTLGTQTEIFTYTRSQQSANRRAACGDVKCSPGQSCDEFPFASTTDGGIEAIANCIISLGNSIQGGFLGSLLKDKDIQENDHYELRLSNVDCEKLLASDARKRNVLPVGSVLPVRPELHARQQTSGLTTQMQSIQLLEFSPFTEFDFYNHSVYYIGDLASGQYTVNVRVDDGIVDELHIVDYQGFAYASFEDLIGILDPPVSLSFSLPEDAVGITLMLSFLIDYNVSSSMITGPAGPLASSGPLPIVSSVIPGGFATGIPSLSSAAVNRWGGLFSVLFGCITWVSVFLGGTL